MEEDKIIYECEFHLVIGELYSCQGCVAEYSNALCDKLVDECTNDTIFQIKEVK